VRFSLLVSSLSRLTMCLPLNRISQQGHEAPIQQICEFLHSEMRSLSNILAGPLPALFPNDVTSTAETLALYKETAAMVGLLCQPRGLNLMITGDLFKTYGQQLEAHRFLPDLMFSLIFTAPPSTPSATHCHIRRRMPRPSFSLMCLLPSIWLFTVVCHSELPRGVFPEMLCLSC